MKMIGIKTNGQPKLINPKKKCHQFSLNVSNLLESDLNLLECLMTDLVIPQDLLDQFPNKYKERFSTGVTWYKNRTFVVNSWKILFTKFQTCLTKMEKSIITNKENYLKYILKQYEHFRIVQHCSGDLYMVEEAFFKIYKQKISQNLQKIHKLSDKLPRSAGSINLLEDFQRKTREKRKCLKVVRHMFEQNSDKGIDPNKSEIKLNSPEVKETQKGRMINKGFDFVSVNLPKLNIDSCVRLSNISQRVNLSGLIDELESKKKREENGDDKGLGDKTVTESKKGTIEIDFKQICSDIKVISAFANSKVDALFSAPYKFEKDNDSICDKMFDTELDAMDCDGTSENDMDISEDDELNEEKSIVTIDLDYQTICYNIRLISELVSADFIDKPIDNNDDTGDDCQLGENYLKPDSHKDNSETLLVEKSTDVETSFILEERVKDYLSGCNAQVETLEDLLNFEEIIEIESLTKLKEATQVMNMNDDDEFTDYLISLNESSKNDASALLDEDEDLLIQHCDEMYSSSSINEINDLSEEGIDVNVMEKSYEMVDEEISFLVHNNSKINSKIEDGNSFLSGDSADTSILSEQSADASIISGNSVDTCIYAAENKDNEDVENEALHCTEVDDVNEDRANDQNIIASTEIIQSMNTPVKTAPTAETKILFCSWMNAVNDAIKDEIEKTTPNDRTIDIDIEYGQICSDIALITSIVDDSSVSSWMNKELDSEKYDNVKSDEKLLSNNGEDIVHDEVPETALSREEEDLLKQEFLCSGTVEQVEEKLDSCELPLDLEVEEEPASPIMLQKEVPIDNGSLSNSIIQEVAGYNNEAHEHKGDGNEIIKPLPYETKTIESCDEEAVNQTPISTPMPSNILHEAVDYNVKHKAAFEDKSVGKEIFQHVDELKTRHDAPHENKNVQNETIEKLDSKKKIAESFDDMFKSFLMNPMKTPEKEASGDYDVNSHVKSKVQLDSGKNKQGKEKGVSQALDELQKLDATKLKVKSQKNTKIKAATSKKTQKEDFKDVKNVAHFDVKQEIADQTDLLPTSKTLPKNEIITLDDDSDNDDDTKPTRRSKLKSNKSVSSPSVVYVPHNAKILHVPDHTKLVRVKTDSSHTSLERETSNDNLGDNTAKPAGKHTALNKSLIGEKTNNLISVPTTTVQTRKRMSNQAILAPIPLKQSAIPPSTSLQSADKSRGRILSQAPTKRAVNARTSRAEAQSSQVLSKPQPVRTSSRQSVQVVQQATKAVSSSVTLNKSGQSAAVKRKNQTENIKRRKSARLESDVKRKVEYVSEPESDGGNQQSELLEFISENILTKAEMKPHGQVTYIYHCNLCSFKNGSKWHLENHVESTHGDFDVSYQCDLCDFIAKTRANYYAHGKKKHNIHMEPQY